MKTMSAIYSLRCINSSIILASLILEKIWTHKNAVIWKPLKNLQIKEKYEEGFVEKYQTSR